VTSEEVLEVLERHGSILKGHFKLSSGRHADRFVQKFRVFEHPRVTVELGRAMAAAFPEGFDVVASPAVGALLFGFATALAGDARFVFAERVHDEMALRRGFSVTRNERVLVVEDVVTTGGSAREVVDLVATTGAEVVGLGVLLDRGDPARVADLGTEMRALARMEVESFDPSECPLCERGMKLDDPGSRRLQA
jgi:orotate phosphoribosyltransferase